LATIRTCCPRRNNPAASAAHINARREPATAVPEGLAVWLTKYVVPPVPGCQRERALGQAVLKAVARGKLLECRNTIGAAVTVGVEDDQPRAPELNPGHRVGILSPPRADLLGVCGGFGLPLLEARCFGPASPFEGNLGGEDRDASCRES
jgi:hypothetical protein